MDADKFLSWLSEVDGEIRKEKMKECQPDRYDDGLMAATGTIREYVEKMCKIDEAEGKADQSWIPCSERFPDGDRLFLYRLKTPQCRISRDMKKMTRVARSIREMMKNHIQAMDFLRMPGCRCRNCTGERMSKTMRLIDADMLTGKVTKWLNPDPNADRMVNIDDIAASVLMEIEEQPTVPLWISVEDSLPEGGDSRFYMCLVENHLEDPPMFCQYEEGYGFGFWRDIYDSVTLGFVDSEFETMEDLKYEKVLYWMPMIELPEEVMQDD